MFNKIFLYVAVVSLWCCMEVTAQSVYTNRENVGIQVMGSVMNTSNDLSGSSIGMGLSFNRNVDLVFSITDFEGNPGYHGAYEVVGGGIGFYPIQQWDEHPITVGVFFSGARSTLSGANGWTFLVGSGITREVMFSEQLSFYPAASFSYAPFVSNRGDGSSFFSLESALSYNFANVINLVFSPSLNVALNSNYSTLGLSFGIVL